MARIEESSGVAKAGLTTGIIGTSLAGLLALNNSNGNGLLGGLLGGCNHNASMAGGAVALGTISDLQAKLAQSNAERYSDNIGTGVYAAINTNLKEYYAELIATREKIARSEVREECNAEKLARMSSGLEEVQREVSDMRVREQATTDAINCLAKTTQERFDSVYQTIGCCKNDLMSYVNATFVPGKLVMPQSAICPEVMSRYNSWTAPTTTTAAAA